MRVKRERKRDNLDVERESKIESEKRKRGTDREKEKEWRTIRKDMCVREKDWEKECERVRERVR